MGTTKMVARNDLKTEFFVRKHLDDDYVIQLGELYEAGVEIPPITVVEKTMEVVDGRHRLAAHDLLNRDMVPVKFVPAATRMDLICEAFKANYGGPRPPTREDIEFTISQLVDGGMGQAKIAEALPFPKSLVRRYVANVISSKRRQKVSAAAQAVLDGGMTVVKAAEKFEIEPEDLKGVLSGKRKRNAGVGEYKAGITSRFRSTSLKNANVIKTSIDAYEDGKLSEKNVRTILDHVSACIRQMTHSHAQSVARFDAKVQGEKKKSA